MARIRSVKPELRDSNVVASWPVHVRYFWVLLWGYLDDEGRGLDLPKRIAGDCFPHEHDDYSGKDVDGWLGMMSKPYGDRPGLVCRYVVGGKRYLHAVNWREHQKPNRPTPSRIPRCPLHEGLTESPPGDSRDGAAEQGSRGAGEQQQRRANESLTPKPTDAQRRVVADATDATDDEADAVVALVRTERQPRNLGAFLRRLAADGDLSDLLKRVRDDRRRTDAAARIRAARDGPECDHSVPGGAELHPDGNEPLCALCRVRSRAAATDPDPSSVEKGHTT